MKLFSYGFNGRSSPAKISVEVDEDDTTRIYFPSVTEPLLLRKGCTVDIEISGNSPGPDVAILVEADCWISAISKNCAHE